MVGGEVPATARGRVTATLTRGCAGGARPLRPPPGPVRRADAARERRSGARRRRRPRRVLAGPLGLLARPAAGGDAGGAGLGRARTSSTARVGNGGGYPATLDDVGAAIDALADCRRRPRSTCAVSSRSATRPAATSRRGRRPARRPCVAVTGVVAQAGVLDLRRAARERLGDGAAQALLGGEPDEVPDRYVAASPIEHLPTRRPGALRPRPGRRRRAAEPERRLRRRRRGGRRRTSSVAVVDGDHFVVIDPASVAWRTVLDWLDDW